MTDRSHLTDELRAAREEQVRRERNYEAIHAGGLCPPRDPAFQRLQTLSAEELSIHIERLERDLKHLEAGPEAWKTAEEEQEDGGSSGRKEA